MFELYIVLFVLVAILAKVVVAPQDKSEVKEVKNSKPTHYVSKAKRIEFKDIFELNFWLEKNNVTCKRIITEPSRVTLIYI